MSHSTTQERHESRPTRRASSSPSSLAWSGITRLIISLQRPKRRQLNAPQGRRACTHYVQRIHPFHRHPGPTAKLPSPQPHPSATEKQSSRACRLDSADSNNSIHRRAVPVVRAPHSSRLVVSLTTPPHRDASGGAPVPNRPARTVKTHRASAPKRYKSRAFPAAPESRPAARASRDVTCRDDGN